MSSSRRPRAKFPRGDRITFKLTREEKAAVRDAAGRSGKALGAWAGETVVRAANLQEMTASQAQLETLRELIKITELASHAVTRLHQAPDKPRATGACPDLSRAIGFLMKVMAQADDAAKRVKRGLR